LLLLLLLLLLLPQRLSGQPGGPGGKYTLVIKVGSMHACKA
jgi:hypothetical protein